jgi:hypothetical protein
VALLERQRSSLLATEDLEPVIVSVAVCTDSTDTDSTTAAPTVTASGLQHDFVLAALSNSSSNSSSSSSAVTGDAIYYLFALYRYC